MDFSTEVEFSKDGTLPDYQIAQQDNIDMKNKTIINISEVEKLFKEYCEENKMEFSEKKFKEFLKFLEIDFYDWVKENLKQFNIN